MTQEEFEKQKELAIINQGRMISEWKKSECYALVQNTLLAMEKTFKMKKQRLIDSSGVSIKEGMIYYAGMEDCVGKVFEEIDRIVANAQAIENKNAEIANYQD